MQELFKALSDETRLRILALLVDEELCVCEIEASLRLTQSNASRHLNFLRRNGILTSRKRAQWTYYHISDSFKVEHDHLYRYLKDNLCSLPTYGADREIYHGYRLKDTCGCGKNKKNSNKGVLYNEDDIHL